MRGLFLTIVGCFVVGLTMTNDVSAAQRTDRPNVVYMMLDEIGYFELSFMGHKTLKTPNLDRLASEGMRFTQCYAGSTVCARSRLRPGSP